MLTVKFVLELFAGSCRWSRAAAAEGNYVLSIDLRFGDGNDLADKKLQDGVLGWFQAGWILYALMGFPCSSFSRARNQPGGPPALRDDAHVQGFDGLRAHDERKVRLGNNLLRFVVRVITVCIVMKVPAIAENPFASWAWKMPGALHLLSRPIVRFTRSDFCQWGTAWRKATGFLTVYIDTQPIHRVCRGRCKCSRSGLPHVVLSGTNCDGVFLTHIAEPYPYRLCKCLVKCCENAVKNNMANNLDALFCPTSSITTCNCYAA